MLARCLFPSAAIARLALGFPCSTTDPTPARNSRRHLASASFRQPRSSGHNSCARRCVQKTLVLTAAWLGEWLFAYVESPRAELQALGGDDHLLPLLEAFAGAGTVVMTSFLWLWEALSTSRGWGRPCAFLSKNLTGKRVWGTLMVHFQCYGPYSSTRASLAAQRSGNGSRRSQGPSPSPGLFVFFCQRSSIVWAGSCWSAAPSYAAWGFAGHVGPTALGDSRLDMARCSGINGRKPTMLRVGVMSMPRPPRCGWRSGVGGPDHCDGCRGASNASMSPSRWGPCRVCVLMRAGR